MIRHWLHLGNGFPSTGTDPISFSTIVMNAIRRCSTACLVAACAGAGSHVLVRAASPRAGLFELGSTVAQ